MSMIGWLLAVSPAQIGALRATPSLVSDLVWAAQKDQIDAQRVERLKVLKPEERSAAEEHHRAAMKDYEAVVSAGRARLEPLGPFAPALSLEKSWHVLHYAFTGHIGPEKAPGDALLTGEPLGDDLGYGPARLHYEKETRDFAEFLAALELPQLEARVNWRELSEQGVYPIFPTLEQRQTVPELEEDLRHEIEIYFPLLRDYVAEAAKHGNGFLTWVS